MSVLKREINIIALVFLCGILFIPMGCKKKAEFRGRTSSILYFSFLGSSVEGESDSSLIESFSNQTDNRVTRKAIMPADVLSRKRDYLTGTQTPDVITWIQSGEDTDFGDENLFLDLENVWVDEGWVEKCPPAVLGACRTADTLYMVPFKVDTWKIFYRKSLFHDLNVSVPQSWDLFLETCETLSEGGVTPVALGAKFAWPASLWFEYINIRVNGSSFHHSLMRGTVPFDREKVEKALKIFALLVENDVFTSDSLAQSWASALKDFSEKKTGMYLFNDSLLNSLPPEITADIGAFSFPVINTQLPQTLLGTVQGWVVPGSAQNTRGALQFLRFCGSAPGQQELAGMTGTPLLLSADMKYLEGADTILPEINRLAPPAAREAVLKGITALLEDPSKESVARVVQQMEQAW